MVEQLEGFGVSRETVGGRSREVTGGKRMGK